MKFQIGKFTVMITDVSFDKVLKLSLAVDYESDSVKAAVFVDYWQGVEHPLVIKGQLITEEMNDETKSS